MKKSTLFAMLGLSALLMAQVSGPTTQTPRLTVGTGTRATNGNLRVNGNVTVTGTCTGCSAAATTPGGSTTHVQFNDAGAFNGDAGLTYNKTTDALTVAGVLTVASCSGCAGAVTGATFASKSADTSRTNNTLLIDPHLQVTGLPAGIYRVESFLSLFTTNATPDIKVCWDASANSATETAGGQRGRMIETTQSSPATPGNAVSGSQAWSSAGACGGADVYQVGASTTAFSLHAIGYIRLTGTGTLALFWGQNTTDANAMTVTQGSWFSVQKVN